MHSQTGPHAVPGHSGGTKPRGKIYVASSWRNTVHPTVVHALREARFAVYDFKNPPAGTGFAWDEIGLAHTNPVHGHPAAPDVSDRAEFLHALTDPRALAGFNSDYTAMQHADAIIAVAPCGRSAHLELGWGAGAGKLTAILLDDPCTPELMYLAVDHCATTIDSLLKWLDHELPAADRADRIPA
ncbi:hypothetical protein ACLXNF_21640 [Mycobacteroides chelonae]|uniref:hypothetical protein n=1 Tax=Mycobacteroides chelonae TaxID=1774 RepID=UPI0039E7507F